MHVCVKEHDIQEMISIGRSHTNIKTCWVKMNWYTVDTSHRMIKLRGRKGHVLRQAVRHKMWKIVQNDYPEFRMYKIPYSIRGDSPCRVKLIYKIFKFFKIW